MALNSELAELLSRQATGYAIVLLCPQGKVTDLSAGAKSLFDPGAPVTSGSFYAEAYPAEERESVSGDLDRCAAEGPSRVMRRIRRGEDFVQVEESITPLRRSDGTLAGFGCILRDASGEQRLQAAVNRANEELQEFVFSVSHDLQEPLRTVRSYSELLLRRYKSQLDKTAIEFLDFVVDAGARMNQLLKDLLAYSQAGRSDLIRLEMTNMTVIVQWALMNLDAEISSSGARVSFGELPGVMADQNQMAQVMQQLIGNGIKYRSSHAPEIRISAERTAESTWELSVHDNGVGVEPQYHDRVFGLFKRLVGKDVPGTGTGLAISRKIVNAHGGKIWMEGELGKGSIVKFTLPAHD